jgi:hypothetical protein
VSNARNVRSDFHPARQPHSCNLAQSGVRLPGRNSPHDQTYPSLLRRALKSRSLCLLPNLLTAFTHQLTDCRHSVPSFASTIDAGSASHSAIAHLINKKNPSTYSKGNETHLFQNLLFEQTSVRRCLFLSSPPLYVMRTTFRAEIVRLQPSRNGPAARRRESSAQPFYYTRCIRFLSTGLGMYFY